MKKICNYFEKANSGILSTKKYTKEKLQWTELVYTPQANNAFRAFLLVSSEVNSKYYSPPSARHLNKTA